MLLLKGTFQKYHANTFMNYFAYCCLDAVINTDYFTERASGRASKTDSCDNSAHSAQVWGQGPNRWEMYLDKV